MNNNENEAVTRNELHLVVNEMITRDEFRQAVSEIRAGQRWTIGLIVAIILGTLGLGTPLVLDKFSAEIRAAAAEAVAPLARQIGENSSDIRWIEKSLDAKAAD